MFIGVKKTRDALQGANRRLFDTTWDATRESSLSESSPRQARSSIDRYPLQPFELISRAWKPTLIRLIRIVASNSRAMFNFIYYYYYYYYYHY